MKKEEKCPKMFLIRRKTVSLHREVKVFSFHSDIVLEQSLVVRENNEVFCTPPPLAFSPKTPAMFENDASQLHQIGTSISTSPLAKSLTLAKHTDLVTCKQIGRKCPPYRNRFCW